MDDHTSDADAERDTGVETDTDITVETEAHSHAEGGHVVETKAGAPIYADAGSEIDARWMDAADGRILEFIQSEDVFEPSQFEEEGICPGKFAAYRCRELAKYGLLKRHMPGVYEITDAGERYLAGDLDPSELEPDE
ncbi:hypothetical protein [Natrinema amylolyticum]|uniref:hypothetical protein n=1 Tax=Natrinema amylolyticum TaxID=2878679 RepID=UPI001CF9FDB1|nr:hypothetical protein [Natrinema amylolyticum]